MGRPCASPFLFVMGIKNAYEYSIRLLSKRDYSKFKLKMKLLQREYSEGEIDEAIKELEAKNFLREEEYMRIRVKTLLLNGHANRIIQMKLEQEELYPSDDFINTLREENGLIQSDVITSLIEKKLRGKTISSDMDERIKLQNKIMNSLASKGFEYHDIKEKVQSYFNERVNS